MVNTDATFQAAADTVQALVQGGQLTDQATQLQLYGLYKQATCGDCDTAAPPFYQLKAKQKWYQESTHANSMQYAAYTQGTVGLAAWRGGE